MMAEHPPPPLGGGAGGDLTPSKEKLIEIALAEEPVKPTPKPSRPYYGPHK